uniref:Uncharacterized protein n=1 Tax=candidate division WOR-3 bacterium TaxID=2052148 RepID=A0A7V3ZV68_UNCW3
MRNLIISIFFFISQTYSFKIFFDYDNWELKVIKEPADTAKEDWNYLVKSYLRTLIYDSDKTLDEFLLLHPRIERKFNHLPLNWQEKRRSFLSDGREIIEYSLSLKPLFSIIPLKTGTGIPIGQLACPLCKRPWPEDLPVPEGVKLIPYEEPNVFKENYTGIIIDARHLSLKPVLFFKIYNEELKEIYSVAFADSLSLLSNGLCSYVKSLEEAFKHPKAGNFPLYISALKITGKNKCDLIIANKDALTLHSCLNNIKLLEKCRVIVVYKDEFTFEK